jgi:hypothetical protein
MIKMAVKRSTSKTQGSRLKTQKLVEPVETIEHLAPQPRFKFQMKKGKLKVAAGVVLALILVGGFWYKTNSWPIVALAGMRPVTRFEVGQELFSQYGQAAVENRITEILVKKELGRLGVTVTAAEVQAKVDDIKSNLGAGADLNQLLQSRGMTLAQFESQLRLQLRVEKALADKVSVTDQEVADYLKQNQQFITATGEAATTQAGESLKYSKLQEEVGKWVDELKTKAKVWRAPGF